MVRHYTVRYRQQGQWRLRKIKRVIQSGAEGLFWWFHLEDDSMRYLSIHTEIRFPPERNKLIEKQVSADAGQPVQRAL